jgi:hypothetical protein
MATIAKGILGPVNGKVGTVVGTTWKGIPVIRSLPKSGKNRTFSPAQLEQQAKFGMVVSYLQPLSTLLSITFKKFAKKKTPFNTAVAHTVENVVTGTYPTFAIDWTKLQISRGSHAHVSQLSTTLNGSNVVFDWEGADSPTHPEHSDKAIMVAYAPASGRCIFDISSVTKGMGTGVLSVSSFTGQVVHTYLAFMTADAKKMSGTVYTGQFTA